MAADKLLAEWFWTDRWMGSSAFLLPLEARGLYREMLTQAWRRGARLPNDFEAIQRAIGCTKKEWSRAWIVVEKYWRVEGDSLVNDTQLEVYRETQERMARATERAKKGAHARAQALLKHNASNCSSTAQAPLEQHSEATTWAHAVHSVCAASSAQALLEHYAPSPSPSPDVVSSKLHKERRVSVTPDQDALERRAGQLLERYAELFLVHRKGARYHNRMHLDFQKAQELVQTWTDDARLEKLAEIILTTDDDWISRTDRGFGVFAAKASWADDRLVVWEAEHQH